MSHTAAGARRNPPAAPPAAPPTAPPAAPPADAKPETEAEAAERKLLESVRGFTETPAMIQKDGVRPEREGALLTASAPSRARKPVQLAMDNVGRKAYQDWVKAGRPTLWQRMPVITYFLDPEDVAKYKGWIRKVADDRIVLPEEYDKDGKHIVPTGVRIRFGTEFVLTPDLAKKIGQEDKVGKTVLAWAVIDKRPSPKTDTK